MSIVLPLRKDSDIKPGTLPADVLAYWRAKHLKVGFDYRDVWKEEHLWAFTAAKVMRTDVLEALHDELDRAIEQGTPLKQWQKQIEPRMQALGWWAPHEVVDPETGKKARVDPPRRLRMIFETNMRTARAVGQWNRIQRQKHNRPYLLYQLGPSERHRPEHVAWHGVLLPADDPWWQTHFTPNGWGCKCTIRSVTRREADELEQTGVLAPDAEPELDADGNPTGHVVDRRVPVMRGAPADPLVPWENKRTGKIELVPKGVDPGFNYPPAVARERALAAE